MKNKILKYFPALVHIPMLIVFGYNFIVYEGTIQLNALRLDSCINITTSFDRAIPFIPFFAIFYVMAYFQWFYGFNIVMRDTEKEMANILAVELLAKTICLIIYLVFPTTLDAFTITGNGFFDSCVKAIKFFDYPTNLFPSVHCLESWIIFRFITSKKNISCIDKWMNGILTFLVFASVLFIKQHVFMDIISAIVVVEISIAITKHFKIDAKVLEIYNKIFKNHSKGRLE